MNKRKLLPAIVMAAVLGFFAIKLIKNTQEGQFISYTVNPNKHSLKFYWKDDKGVPFRSLSNLKNHLADKSQKLLFATNGGMFREDHSPKGLFIQDGEKLNSLDRLSGDGNFYLKPNGVFFITKTGEAGICETSKFPSPANIQYATQSGPMLVIDGVIHPAFKKGSANLNVRNGVGILPGNQVVFAMSKGKTSFYDFASYFKALGCQQALYLDGFVSRTYLPEKDWEQTDGDFAVIIGVAE